MSGIDLNWEVIIRIIFDLVICIGAIVLVRIIFSKMAKRNNGIHIKFFRSLIIGVLIIVFLFDIMDTFGASKSIGSTLLKSSALLIAVATFAAQQALGNVISGFMISATKPYDIMEKVKVLSGGSIIAEGIVEDITVRHTVIKTFDGQSCIVPNSIMDNSVIVNTNYTENVGNFLEVEVSYGSDVEKAIEIVKKTVIEQPETINDDTMIVTVSSFATNGVIIKTTVWTKNLSENFIACSDIRRKLLRVFADNGIVIPYQTITIDKDL